MSPKKNPCDFDLAPSHYLDWHNGYNCYCLMTKRHVLVQMYDTRAEALKALRRQCSKQS